MFAQKNRLRKGYGFQRVYRRGRRKQGDTLSVIFFERKDRLTPVRFGVVVPNTVSTRATKRNVIRRKIRALLEPYTKLRGVDVVVTVHAPAGSFRIPTLRKDISLCMAGFARV